MSRSTGACDPAVRLEVRVTPRARQDAIHGLHDGRLKVALRAAPADGAANDALVSLLARALGIRQRDVEILRGATSRNKTLAIHGVSPAMVGALGAGNRPEPAGTVPQPPAKTRQ